MGGSDGRAVMVENVAARVQQTDTARGPTGHRPWGKWPLCGGPPGLDVPGRGEGALYRDMHVPSKRKTK